MGASGASTILRVLVAPKELGNRIKASTIVFTPPPPQRHARLNRSLPSTATPLCPGSANRRTHYVYRSMSQLVSAQISAVDRLGMYVVVGMPDGQSGKLRLPFPRPAESRKDVKTLIVEMTQAAAAGAAET